MSLSLSKKSSLIAQSEIRAMTLACARVGGINLAQGVCDTELPLPVRAGAHEAIDAGINIALSLLVRPGKRDTSART